MKKISSKLSFILFSIFLAFIPIIYEYLKNETSLRLDLVSKTSIISINQPVKNIEIYYNSQKIDELSKVEFRLINDGRNAISSEEFISPIEIKFFNSTPLDIELISTAPENLITDFSLNEDSVKLKFDLANPSDEILFNVLLNGRGHEFKVLSKIKNIKLIKIEDESIKTNINKNLGISGYLSLIFGSLSLLGSIAMASELPKRRRALRFLDLKLEKISDAQSFEQAAIIFMEDYRFILKKNRPIVFSKLAEINYPMDDKSRIEIRELIKSTIKSESIGGGSLVFLVISAYPLFYSLKIIFN